MATNSTAPPLANSGAKRPAPPSDVDVLISTSGASGLDFLDGWKNILSPYHLIIVIYGGGAKPALPAGFNADLYTSDDFAQLGSSASCLTTTKRGCISFGILMSTKKYVLVLDEYCVPAPEPKSTTPMDTLQAHVDNLDEPSTPFFFNTLYDPFRTGADFVRGYPFSLRDGVPTAISHGLWLNVPDYDAPTRMVKPRERNHRYVDATLTVPRGVMFPMSSLNLAFNRELIGVALYMAEGQEDIWAGWCSKVIADHLGYGIKTGLPYVINETPKGAIDAMNKDAFKAFSPGQDAFKAFSPGQVGSGAGLVLLLLMMMIVFWHWKE
eukprot:gene16427-22641_t